MKVRHLILVAAIGLLVFSSVQAEELNPVLGKAGDYVLREADFDRLLANQSDESRKALLESPEQRSAAVRQILLVKATAARARKEGFDRKPEVKELLSNLIDQYLAQEYLAKVVAATVTVTEEEMKTYHKEHEEDLRLPESAMVRHILISSPKESSPEERKKARERAEGILAQIRKGEDFAKLAGEASEDSDSAAKGGDLGLLTPGKTNSPEFEQGVFGLKAGEVSDIVETPFGYHIIKADERTEARTATLEESREYIRKRLLEQNRQKAAQEFLDRLSRETGLEVAGETTTPVKP